MTGHQYSHRSFGQRTMVMQDVHGGRSWLKVIDGNSVLSLEICLQIYKLFQGQTKVSLEQMLKNEVSLDSQKVEDLSSFLLVTLHGVKSHPCL